MSTSMVSTVLEIEREAEAVLAKAEQEAVSALDAAKKQIEDASRSHAESIRKEIAGLEEKAAADRAKKVKELTASGDAALSAVKNISDAAFDKGVQHIVQALSGK